ncbi:nuclear autoantigenic sperm protein [Apis laboriosa]|uniref:nuclear autoantigenic sperm protein n=1 Tax=Apis laboriosa TaxID=183418 RepID=UPI001CC60F0D|nr:nuclear autoantigenic sperm protein [Apis laboriosa]XP_043786030.1 nuclear autoantigenic sperm protein [Apis laboriosa]XP_043786031.1 nuclear autoantigenic sperm protein [Apis laboriosa]XP_043786033.1 nuclear autoantigenic sperm protein [Apis laboriosa]XP_043786034.1 nuclear autoantigenic sperm protein [Apis laboriosa]XP_043786035.1 nuclear autoantigenic sperm protein [Apis laboriosa]XP_043786036.1 nuclear autoantigenic sperm protein [Apis laboriosa]
MADVAESAAFTDPATAISHGKRHLLVRDYTMAVTALAQACQLLAEKHGDTADELGEPYLLYGRALLGLAREEAGVLGGGVPGTEETEEDDEEDEEEAEDEKLSNIDEKEDEESEDHTDNGTVSDEKEKTAIEDKAEDSKADQESKKPEIEQKEEKIESNNEKQEVEKSELDKTEDSKITKQVIEKPEKEDEEKPAAGSSKDISHANGPSCSSDHNGDVKKNGENDSEDIGNEDEEDEVNNLQVAWEVLELAKLVLLKRGQTGWKLLADAYRLLGEVAMEGGNFQGALNDLHRCLELLQQIEPQEPRAIAEIHYQLALAHSLGNEFDASIEEFNKATELLETRIKELEEIKEPPKTDDSFYTVEGEIQELKELLPEIQEKISDMKDFKQEACKLVIEGIKSKVAGGCSNGAGPSGNNDSAPKIQKPASDISHLVRKKRKADEPETEVASPCKKPTPEKAV